MFIAVVATRHCDRHLHCDLQHVEPLSNTTTVVYDLRAAICAIRRLASSCDTCVLRSRRGRIAGKAIAPRAF